jgi:ubiquinone/menaquinone biosynthesis C-methylase UbiE
MKDQPEWKWNELLHAGVDYADPAQVEIYDRRVASYRNVAEENRQVFESLELTPDKTLLEIGVGTGRLTLEAAGRCRHVYACDVSQAMLAWVGTKLKERQIPNVELAHGGFLTYEHTAPPVDAAVSQVALHHLPDFWKAVALRRIWQMLKPGGRFYLLDVVFSFDMDDYQGFMEKWTSNAPDVLRTELCTHARQEYSTLDWIMEGLLERAGFRLVKAEYDKGFLARYLCEKPGR